MQFLNYLTYLILVVFTLYTSGCGGGFPPSELRNPRVEIQIEQPAKRIFLRHPSLNLVVNFAKIGDRLLVVGSDALCQISESSVQPTCFKYPIDLWDVQVVTIPELFYVANGGWGEPSVVVLNSANKILWRYDAKFEAMGKPIIVHNDGKPVIVLENEKIGWIFLDLFTGKQIKTEKSRGELLGSADFNGDGQREMLIGPSENIFIISTASGKNLAKLEVNFDYWYQPIITDSSSCLVLSASESFCLYNKQLIHYLTFVAPGAKFPLHAVSFFVPATKNGRFVALVKGRGGWHKSILYVYSHKGNLIYKEILNGDFQSVTTLRENEKEHAFLIGGRGEVIEYVFKNNTTE